MINSTYNTAAYGINLAQTRLNSAAQEVAGAITQRATPSVEAMVDLKVASRDVQANVKTIQSADQMLGSLLDILA